MSDVSGYLLTNNITIIIGAPSVVDPLTVSDPNSRQKVMIERLNNCLYTVGAHPQSSQQQPLVTITQWNASSATAAPKKMDQVCNYLFYRLYPSPLISSYKHP
jgi:hypothetical protein